MRRRCIYEGVSADEDVFMKAKMYSWRRQRWRRCIYKGMSALTNSADEDVFIKAKACQRWRSCIDEGVSVRMCLFRKGSIYESPAKPSCRAGDWAQGLPHAERVWYHYTNCPLQVEAPLGGSKEVSGCLSWLAGRVFLPVLLLWCVLRLFLFGPSWWCLGLWRLLEPAGTCPERAGKPVPLNHHSIPLHQLPPCQRGRRCIYEGEGVFMKVSALTKMYLWMRRCIYEGVSADEDVFMNAKMYSWRCQRWRRCFYEGEDVFMKASALTKMYLWRRRCIYEGVSADEDVFTNAKMYSWRCQRWRRCIYEGEDVFMKVSALTKMYLWMRKCIHEYIFAFINASSSALTP